MIYTLTIGIFRRVSTLAPGLNFGLKTQSNVTRRTQSTLSTLSQQTRVKSWVSERCNGWSLSTDIKRTHLTRVEIAGIWSNMTGYRIFHMNILTIRTNKIFYASGWHAALICLSFTNAYVVSTTINFRCGLMAPPHSKRLRLKHVFTFVMISHTPHGRGHITGCVKHFWTFYVGTTGYGRSIFATSRILNRLHLKRMQRMSWGATDCYQLWQNATRKWYDRTGFNELNQAGNERDNWFYQAQNGSASFNHNRFWVP